MNIDDKIKLIKKVYPDLNYPPRVPDVYYSINDDIFGLTKKQKELRQSVFDFTQDKLKINALKSDENKNSLFQVKQEFCKELGNLGFMGIAIEQYFGGGGGCYMDQIIVQEELARTSAISTLYFNSHANHCIYPIHCFGTKQQKCKYLPKLCSGEYIGTKLISNLEKSSLTKIKAEKQGNYYILNGSDGDTPQLEADIVVVYAITNSNIEFGITVFIVERNFEGFIVLQDSTTNSQKFKFVDCKVPVVNMIGEKNKGIEILMSSLNFKSLISAGGSVGLMQALCDTAFENAYMKNQFTELKGKLCGMLTKLCASRNYLYTVIRACDNGYMNCKDSDAVALYCTRNLTKLTLETKEILGKNVDAAKRLLGEALLYEITINLNELQREVISELISDEYSK